MSTRAFASAVINKPLDKVWKELREFTFPAKIISTIQSVQMDDGSAPTTVGSVRTVVWKSGEQRKHRLLEVSDFNNTVVWELIESNPTSEVIATINFIKCVRISDGNQTLVSWEGEFSHDVTQEIILFEQKSYQLNLQELKTYFN